LSLNIGQSSTFNDQPSTDNVTASTVECPPVKPAPVKPAPVKLALVDPALVDPAMTTEYPLVDSALSVVDTLYFNQSFAGS
jgi:hypothetical protein